MSKFAYFRAGPYIEPEHVAAFSEFRHVLGIFEYISMKNENGIPL
jgi:hypothetical protein